VFTSYIIAEMMRRAEHVYGPHTLLIAVVLEYYGRNRLLLSLSLMNKP